MCASCGQPHAWGPCMQTSQFFGAEQAWQRPCCAGRQRSTYHVSPPQHRLQQCPRRRRRARLRAARGGRRPRRRRGKVHGIEATGGACRWAADAACLHSSDVPTARTAGPGFGPAAGICGAAGSAVESHASHHARCASPMHASSTRCGHSALHHPQSTNANTQMKGVQSSAIAACMKSCFMHLSLWKKAKAVASRAVRCVWAVKEGAWSVQGWCGTGGSRGGLTAALVLRQRRQTAPRPARVGGRCVVHC